MIRNREIQNVQNLHFVSGNRKEKEEFSKLLNYLNTKFNISSTNQWHAIIDFCAFKHSEIKV